MRWEERRKEERVHEEHMMRMTMRMLVSITTLCNKLPLLHGQHFSILSPLTIRVQR